MGNVVVQIAQWQRECKYLGPPSGPKALKAGVQFDFMSNGSMVKNCDSIESREKFLEPIDVSLGLWRQEHFIFSMHSTQNIQKVVEEKPRAANAFTDKQETAQ